MNPLFLKFSLNISIRLFPAVWQVEIFERGQKTKKVVREKPDNLFFNRKYDEQPVCSILSFDYASKA